MADPNPSKPVPGTDMIALLAYEAGRRDALGDVLESTKTMSREMLIQWIEAEIAQS